MKKKLIIIVALSVAILCRAQPVIHLSNGAVFSVESNTEMSMLGGITIEEGASLANKGIIRLMNNSIANQSDWIDNSINGALSGTGSVIFNSNLSHAFSGLSNFYSLQINTGELLLNNHLVITNQLHLVVGKITTGANHVFLNNNNPSSFLNDATNTGYTNSWINGNFRRLITINTSTYDFPVGNNSRSNLLQIINNNMNGTGYLTASFEPKPGTDAGLSVTEDGSPYLSVNNGGVWKLFPDASPAGGSYAIQLYFNGFTGLSDNQFGILRRPDASSQAADWEVPSGSSLEVLDAAGRKVSDGYARRINLSDFSQWGIGQFQQALTTWYQDNDQDGYGNPAITLEASSQPVGYVSDDSDCDDNNPQIHPGANEVCNGLDDDCNGFIDDGVLQFFTFYPDADKDGYGDPNQSQQACSAPAGYVADNTDCDDGNSAIYPGATEVCDGVDNDCDGQVDENVTTTWYLDADEDGYGDPNQSQQACSAPAGYVADNTDCDDGNSAIYPGATEVCDGVDNDCDGQVDENVTTTWYLDADEDGYGDPNQSQQACSAPAGYVAYNTDCDDGNSAIYPGAIEVCDGIDNDCNGLTDEAPDNIPPELAGIPVSTSASCHSIPGVANPTATDNCDPQPSIDFEEISTKTNNGTCSDYNYTITRTWTATDNSGNSSSQSQIITVSDLTPPTTKTKNITVYLNASGTITITPEQVNDQSVDNCSSISLSLDNSTFNCSNVGIHTVILTATDACGNSSSENAEVTVVDDINPLAVCRNISVYLDAQTGIATITAAQIDNGSSDACGIATKTLSQYTFNSAGSYSVILTVTDVNGNSSTCNSTVTVNKRPVIIVYTGDNDEQYSDNTNLSAELRDQLTNEWLSNQTINFTIGSQNKSTVTNVSGVATTTLHIYQNVGDYDITASFAGDEIYEAATTTEDYDILKENASIEYTGPEFVSVPCSTCPSTTILLSGILKDTSSGIPPGDPYPGDIRKARVKFVDLNTMANLSGWLTPGLVNPGDTTTGLVTYLWTVPLPNTGYNTYSIGVIADCDNSGVGNYTGYAQTVINVSRSSITEFITGGGHIVPDASGGAYASQPGRKVNFGFNVKWNKSMKNLQGKVNIIFRRETEVYQIKATAMTSLSINSTDPCSKKAIFIGKANLQNVTNPAIAPIPVLGNLTLQLSLVDNGEPGTNSDRIGISLFNGNTLVYSSSIPYNLTMALNGGNIVVHNGIICANNTKQNNSITEIDREVIPENVPFTVMAFPNPSTNNFTINVKGNLTNEKIIMQVVDMYGRVIETRNVSANSMIKFGDRYRPGTYLVRIIQGKQHKEIKLIKISD